MLGQRLAWLTISLIFVFIFFLKIPLKAQVCTKSVVLHTLISIRPILQGLVIAGLGDLSRPAEKLSMSQSGALAATGLIWSR